MNPIEESIRNACEAGLPLEGSDIPIDQRDWVKIEPTQRFKYLHDIVTRWAEQYCNYLITVRINERPTPASPLTITLLRHDPNKNGH